MSTLAPRADDQVSLWNGHAGRTWVEKQQSLDALFQPIEEELVAHVISTKAKNVLDVGCGTGATTLAAARALGTEGICVGMDISEPMLALARRRAETEALTAPFILADAESHHFSPASFDLIISRFGVMFFADAVAFKNLRRATRPRGELLFLAWRSPSENPFMTAAERAAAPLLPLQERVPNAPGQFAFADPKRVRRILEDAGWSRISVEAADFELSLPIDELESYYGEMGPLGVLLSSADEATRDRIIEVVRPAFQPFVQGDEARFNAACWRVSAFAN